MWIDQYRELSRGLLSHLDLETSNFFSVLTTMAEVETSPDTTTTPATIEINDAIFCRHFKEVVRPLSFALLVLSLIDASSSALNVTMTDERRMMLSLGSVEPVTLL